MAKDKKKLKLISMYMRIMFYFHLAVVCAFVVIIYTIVSASLMTLWAGVLITIIATLGLGVCFIELIFPFGMEKYIERVLEE